MTRDDIIRMARLSVIDLYGPMPDEKMYDVFIERCAKFAHLVAAASASVEREAIEQRVLKSDMTMANRLYVVNDLIRARGQV